MASIDSALRKKELRAQLASARLQFDGNWAGFKDDANISKRVKGAVRERKVLFLGGASIVGFLLSRLPARKKEVLVDAKSRRKLGSRKKAGLLLVLAKFLLGVLKPTIMAYATKKMADMASSTADAKEAEADAKEAEADVRREKRKERELPA